MCNISVLLVVQANLPETSLFFVCPKGFGEHLFSNVYSTWDVKLCVEHEYSCSVNEDLTKVEILLQKLHKLIEIKLQSVRQSKAAHIGLKYRKSANT